jgi:hypothetical protein
MQNIDHINGMDIKGGLFWEGTGRRKEGEMRKWGKNMIEVHSMHKWKEHNETHFKNLQENILKGGFESGVEEQVIIIKCIIFMYGNKTMKPSLFIIINNNNKS